MVSALAQSNGPAGLHRRPSLHPEWRDQRSSQRADERLRAGRLPGTRLHRLLHRRGRGRRLCHHRRLPQPAGFRQLRQLGSQLDRAKPERPPPLAGRGHLGADLYPGRRSAGLPQHLPGSTAQPDDRPGANRGRAPDTGPAPPVCTDPSRPGVGCACTTGTQNPCGDTTLLCCASDANAAPGAPGTCTPSSVGCNPLGPTPTPLPAPLRDVSAPPVRKRHAMTGSSAARRPTAWAARASARRSKSVTRISAPPTAMPATPPVAGATPARAAAPTTATTPASATTRRRPAPVMAAPARPARSHRATPVSSVAALPGHRAARAPASPTPSATHPAPARVAPATAASRATVTSGLVCCQNGQSIPGGAGTCVAEANCAPAPCTGQGCACTGGVQGACDDGLVCCLNGVPVIGGNGGCVPEAQCPSSCTGQGCDCDFHDPNSCDQGLVCCAVQSGFICATQAQCGGPCTGQGCDCTTGVQGACDDGLICCAQGDPGAPGTCQTEDACPGSLCTGQGCDCTGGVQGACDDGLICCVQGDPGAPGTCQTEDACPGSLCTGEGCACDTGTQSPCQDGLTCCGSTDTPGGPGVCQSSC